jgi:hypothetical protein
MQTSVPASATAPFSEALPFVVEMAREGDLKDVAALRSASYGKHIPALGMVLQKPEECDYELGCEVIVARSKFDGSLLGTMRVHTNAFKPLPLQTSLRLPERFSNMRMVEATRLCVKGSPNASLVRSALFKALFQYCEAQNVDWMMAAGRRPVDRIYDALLFSDVGESGKFYPMAHAGGVPHRVMSLAPLEARFTWEACEHPLYRFVIETLHKDVNLSAMTGLHFAWNCPQVDPESDSGFAPMSDFTPISRFGQLSSTDIDIDVSAPFNA